jgi:hypothetical protein
MGMNSKGMYMPPPCLDLPHIGLRGSEGADELVFGFRTEQLQDSVGGPRNVHRDRDFPLGIVHRHGGDVNSHNIPLESEEQLPILGVAPRDAMKWLKSVGYHQISGGGFAVFHEDSDAAHGPSKIRHHVLQQFSHRGRPGVYPPAVEDRGVTVQ